MHYARRLARDAGLEAKLVAKVERAETVATSESIDDIILASDVVMVARGDLGVEIGDPELVGVQKKTHPSCSQLKPHRDYCDSNDGVYDCGTDANPSRGHGRCQCRARWYRCSKCFLEKRRRANSQ